MAERMGIDSAATRSDTPLRFPKWVRTEQVAKFEEPEEEKIPEAASQS